MNKNSGTILYFAYGSNLHPLWLNNRVVSAVPVKHVTLEKWKLCFNKRSKRDNSAKCNIIRTGLPADMVHGVIYQFNSTERKILDDAEDGYSGEIMAIGGFDEVLLYVAKVENIDNRLLPYSWYKEIIIAGARIHEFPEIYIDYICSFEAIRDPDIKREQEKKAIIRQVRLADCDS